MSADLSSSAVLYKVAPPGERQHLIYPLLKTNKNSSGDDIASVNFFTTTSYMYRPAPTPVEPTS